MTNQEAIEILEEVKTLDDSMFAYNRAYNDAMNMAIDALKAQEPRVMELKELDFYDPGLYVETRNVCPEELTDELWPALVQLYCVSQNGECGYVCFVNWNADTYDFEVKDYNVRFRCWTSRPTDAQMEAIPWNVQN